MRTTLFFIAVFICLCTAALQSCKLAGDIFQAGMGVGIFLVLGVIGVIIWLVAKARQ